MAKKIKDNFNPDGLIWGRDVKYEDIAYGAKKIIMSMVIEDDKVFILYNSFRFFFMIYLMKLQLGKKFQV